VPHEVRTRPERLGDENSIPIEVDGVDRRIRWEPRALQDLDPKAVGELTLPAPRGPSTMTLPWTKTIRGGESSM
jgi:hypothetical protein